MKGFSRNTHYLNFDIIVYIYRYIHIYMPRVFSTMASFFILLHISCIFLTFETNSKKMWQILLRKINAAKS